MYKIIVIGFVIGWLSEFVYRSVVCRKIVWPIFVNVSMYIITALFGFLVQKYNPSFFLVVLFGLLFTTFLEFIIGFYYMKYKGKRLWDYSSRRFNYKGVITPLFSVIWTSMFLAYYYFLLPVIVK